MTYSTFLLWVYAAQPLSKTLRFERWWASRTGSIYGKFHDFAPARIAIQPVEDIPDYPDWIEEYLQFHNSPNTNETRYLVWVCNGDQPCGGIGDRVRGMVTSFYIALLTRRKLLLWNPEPVDISDVLRPATFNWTANARDVAYQSTYNYYSIDHVNDDLYNLISPDVQSQRVMVVRTNYIIWPNVMNSPNLREARESVHIPHGNGTKIWNEMLFAWAWKALMRPTDALLHDMKVLKESTGLGNDYFAVHIRRGGYWGDPFRHNDEKDLDRFVGCLQNMTNVVGNYPVYVTSDDFASKEKLANASQQHVVYDTTTQPFHVERAGRSQDFVERNRRAWAEFFLISQSTCAIACASGFSIWPVVLSRHPVTGTRCFARFEDCSQDNIRHSMHEFYPIR